MLKYLCLLFVLLFSGAVLAAENPQKSVDNYIAVFDLETIGKVDREISHPLSESIRRALVLSGKYDVIDRHNMNKILDEQKFQMSGLTGQSMIAAGRLLGVGKIITGSVSMLGNTYYLSLSLIDVKSGKIEAVSEDKCECKVDDLIESTRKLVSRIMPNDKQKAIDFFADMSKWGTRGDSYKGFVRDLDKIIASNQNGVWIIGRALTKDNKPYQLQWVNNDFYHREMTQEEAVSDQIGDYQIKFKQFKQK